MPIKVRIASPSQYALKLPATRPDNILSEAPPSREEVTTSFTCRDLMDVKTFTNSGMIAPASVPHVMTAESFHHRVVSPAILGIRMRESANVRATDTSEVSQTRDVSGASKFIFAAFSYLLFAKALFTK